MGPAEQSVNLRQIFEKEWQAHLTATQEVFQFHHLQKIRQLLGNCVWHIEDHCSTAFRAYCPVVYHRALHGTFCSSPAFEDVPASIAAVYHEFYYHTRKLFKTRYTWAFQPEFAIPQAYILPKRKKSFHSGRPIVSFIQACGRGLLEATARALYLLIQRAFPDALQAGDVYKLMEMVHAFFTQADHSLELQGRNQDLAGSPACYRMSFKVHGNICISGAGSFTQLMTSR